MKKLILCLFLMVSFLGANAQTATQNQIDKTATAITRQLAKDLNLNEYGYLRIKDLTAGYLTARQVIQENYSYNPSLQWTKISELDSAYQRRLFLGLKADQMDAYLALRSQYKPGLLTSVAK